MLPNLTLLADEASTALGLGRRLAEQVERRGRDRIDKLHHDHVLDTLEKDGLDIHRAPPDVLKNSWQYYYARYRDETYIGLNNGGASLPQTIRDALAKVPYVGPKKQTEIVDPAPLAIQAYHGEITFDSPDIYEMEAHSWHWWLLTFVRQRYHDVDHVVQQLLHDLVRDATYFVYEDKTALVVRENYNAAIERGDTPGVVRESLEGDAFGGEPSQAAWYWWVKDRSMAQSLHVGDSSHYGISLYWRLEGREIYEYLNRSFVDGRKTFWQGTKMNAPWITEVHYNADKGVITPRQLFEYILKRQVLEPAGADLTCLQERNVTNRFQAQMGTNVQQYRCKYKMAPQYEKYAPSCDDTWPGWEVPKRLQAPLEPPEENER